MRIYVLTQEDSFYIPPLLDHLFQIRKDVLGVAIVPGELRGAHWYRYLRFMGPHDFAVQSANLALHRVLALVGRAVTLGRSFSVADAARRHHVSLERVPRVNDPNFIQSLRDRQVELLVSIACPQICRRPLLDAPTRGAINIHGALLPDYQGMLPSFWVLANGETETGVTIHYMNEEIDAGGILAQERIPITGEDTVHSLVKRAKIGVGKHLLVQTIAQIERREEAATPMDHSRSRYFSFPDHAAVRRFRARGRRFI
jgi:methionyl-tRNA formyltransferase